MTDYIHPNPGYHEYEHSIQNAMKGPELLNSQQYVEDNRVDLASVGELSGIKTWARKIWSRPDHCETTYQFQYPEKGLIERTKSAPTENLRKNNPHPKPVFLTNRLHYVPGYHNADSTLGKPHYQPDNAVEPEELQYRRELKAKYRPEVSTGALRQYAPTARDSEDITKWSRTVPPNDSWMATSSYGAKPGTNRFAKSLDEAMEDSAKADAYDTASHTRFLRLAGADEKRRIQRALDPRGDIDKIPNMNIPYQTKGTIGSQRQADRARVEARPNKPLYRFPRPRGDFLIHPVWPPSMWHHRIPGFRADPPSRGPMNAYERHQATRLMGVY